MEKVFAIYFKLFINDVCSVVSWKVLLYCADETEGSVRTGGSSYLGAAFVVVLISGVAIWSLYAYSNPHSTSGQILIRVSAFLFKHFLQKSA